MAKFRKKPVVIEAVQWTGRNDEEIALFCPVAELNVGPQVCQPECFIRTLEGTMIADHGDWIIRGVKGEFYPCKPDIFDATYESAWPAVSETGEP